MPSKDKRLPSGELVKVEEFKDYDGTGHEYIHHEDGTIETNVIPKTAHFGSSYGTPFKLEA